MGCCVGFKGLLVLYVVMCRCLCCVVISVIMSSLRPMVVCVLCRLQTPNKQRKFFGGFFFGFLKVISLIVSLVSLRRLMYHFRHNVLFVSLSG